jgi:HprK-related kinase A
MTGLAIGELDGERLARALAGPGLVLDLGAIVVRIRSHLPELAEPLRRVYRHQPFADDPDAFVDADVQLTTSPGLRGLLRPSLRFLADGLDPFGELPRDMPLPQLEWGINWCFATMMNRHLLLHAGALEIQGAGVLLMGEPGAGKSTLTAALALRGARVLSDEFGVIRLSDDALLPVPKPIALKNRSIELIASWSSDAILGPTYRKTHKGDVAHLAIPSVSVASRHMPATVRTIVFPRWREGASTSLEPLGKAEAFSAVAFNSFNFGTLGPEAFDAVRRLVVRCDCRRLSYDDLDEATRVVRGLCK